MKFTVVTPYGIFVVKVPDADLQQYEINEYSEEIVECYK